MTMNTRPVPQTLIDDLRAVQMVDLAWDRETRSFDEVLVSPTIIQWDDGTVVLSAEDGLGFAPSPTMEINADLEAIAEAAGYFWEWEDLGTVILCEA